MGLIVIVGGIILSLVLAIMADLSAAAAGLMAAASTAIGLIMIYKQAVKKEAEKQKIQEEEQRRQDEERRRRDEAERRRQAEEREHNTLRFKCPYCGTGYAEYPAKSEEMLRVCEDGCRRHFYPCEDQAPRTPQDAKILETEQLDIQRVCSPEFAPVIAEVEKLVFSTSRDSSRYVVFHWSGISVNDFFSFNSTFHYNGLTEAGCLALAEACINRIGKTHFYFYVEKSPIDGGIRLSWHRREE